MSEVIDESVKEKLEQIFSKLVSPIKLLFSPKKMLAPSLVTPFNSCYLLPLQILKKHMYKK